jgi:hypothetical protein
MGEDVEVGGRKVECEKVRDENWKNMSARVVYILKENDQNGDF